MSNLTPSPSPKERGEKKKLPFYAQQILGSWAVYERCNGYVKLIVYCKDEKEARDTAYRWNGEAFKNKKTV
jgi:hypothetical protein